MKIKAKGHSRHRFWGDYSEHIAIEFASEKEARLVVDKLNEGMEFGEFTNAIGGKSKSYGWNIVENYQGNRFATIEVGGDALEKVLDRLEGYGADRKAITSIKKSIDYGEPFEFTVEAEDPDQKELELK